MLPQRFLDELIYRSDIVDVVNRYVPLKKAGSNYVGLCPFHNEKTPSFSVSQDKQFFHCFGCGEGGNVLSFIMKIENLPFPEAVHKLASITGMTVPEDDSGSDRERRERERILAANKDAARWFREQMLAPGGQVAREYLGRRGLTAKYINAFGLGYAPDSWDDFIKAMKEKGYTEKELEAARLAGRSKRGTLYAFFRDRLMFPIFDVSGNVIAFSGRVLQGDGGGRKYMNSPDTPVYNKSRTLFGLNLAKKSKAGCLMLVEGNMDVISLHQAGFDFAVATCGTALTPDQAKLMTRYTKRIILCYDSDSAGQRAAQKGIDILNAAGLQVQVLKVPGSKDPDEFIRENGPEAFQLLLDKPQTDSEYRLAVLRGQYDLQTDEGRLGYLKEAARFIASLSSVVEREIYARNAARDAGVSPASMLTEVEHARRQGRRQQEKKIQRDALNVRQNLQPQDRELRYDNLYSAQREEKLLALLLQTDDLVELARGLVTPEQFSSPFLGRIYQSLLDRWDSGLSLSVAECMAALQPNEAKRMAQILADYIPSRQPEGELRDYAQAIRFEYEKKQTDGNEDLLMAALNRRREGK